MDTNINVRYCVGMEREISIDKARPELGRLVDDAAIDGTITYLTRRGRRFAALVPLALVDAPATPMPELGDHVDLWDTPRGLIIARGFDALYLLPTGYLGRFAADAAAWTDAGTLAPPVDGVVPVEFEAVTDATTPASWSPEDGVVVLVDNEVDAEGYTMTAAARRYLGYEDAARVHPDAAAE
ncbi:MAG TPA: hypothetical protein VGL93_10665 [Streptosporangiaceae bacterium]|jgi:hypothetical protein